MSVNLHTFINRAASLGDTNDTVIQEREGALIGVKVSSGNATEFANANRRTWATFDSALASRFGRLELADALIEKRSISALTARAVMDTAKDYRLLARLSAENLIYRLHTTDPAGMMELMEHGENRVTDAIIALRQEHAGFDAQEVATILEQVSDRIAAMRTSEARVDYVGSSNAIGLERDIGLAFNADETSVGDRIQAGLLKKGDPIGNPLPDGGRYILEGLKDKGVEPGFLVRHEWLPSHEARMTGVGQEGLQDGFHQEAVTCLERFITTMRFSESRTDCPADGVFWNAVNHMAGMSPERRLEAEDLALQIADGTVTPEQALPQLAPDVLRSYAASQLADSTAPFHNEFTRVAREYLLDSRPEFARHIIKLDYNESERSAFTKSLRLPDRVKQTHGRMYQFVRRQSVQEANRGAVAEALANDLTRKMGVPAQELRLLRAAYADGSPKLLLDGTFVRGAGGATYRDFDFFIRDGYLDKDLLKASGHTGRIDALGSYKAALLLLGDRDGVGSKGQNKGFVGNTFVAIDPGHSLEGNQVTVADDFSFTYRTAGAFTKGFQNFTLFDDSPLSEKMAGWARIVSVVEDEGEEGIAALFAAYSAAFPPGSETDFSADIDRMKNEFMMRYQQMKQTLAPRLALFLTDRPVPGAALVDCLDNLEKLTSETSAFSPKGVVALEHLRTVNRVPWDMERTEEGLRLTCRNPLVFSDSADVLARFLSRNGADAGLVEKHDGFLSVPTDNIGEFVRLLSEDNIRRFKAYQ